MNLTCYRKSSRYQGFTLAELLIAMTITVILISITVTITAGALDTWRGARTEIRAARQAKLALDTLAQDLEALVAREGGTAEWLRIKSDTEEIGPEGNPATNSAKIVFFTSAPDRYTGQVGGQNDQGGNVSLVGYQLTYGDPIFGDNQNENVSTFVLYRELIDPDDTFRSYLGTDDLDRAYRSDITASQARSSDYLCENIYELTMTVIVEYQDSSDDLTRARLPVMTSSFGSNTLRQFAITGEGISTNNTSNSEFDGGRVIGFDLGISVISDEGLRLLKNLTFRDNEARAQFIEKNSYQYTKSVRVPQPF